MYKVICPFTDLKDNGHVYNLGDVYPRDGAQPTKKRISELLGSDNKLHRPLIESDGIADVGTSNEEKPRKKRGKRNENN